MNEILGCIRFTNAPPPPNRLQSPPLGGGTIPPPTEKLKQKPLYTQSQEKLKSVCKEKTPSKTKFG